MSQQIPDFEPQLVMSHAESIVSANASMRWDTAVQTVLSVCCRFPELCPTFRQDNLFSEAHISKWLEKYFNGYNNRSSKRISRKIGTRNVESRYKTLHNEVESSYLRAFG